jgi:peptidoglycan/xylan/chitin deacetylase (PgdA/CDA1 family)
MPAPPARLTLTFDNLGEAADLERGLWPADEPVGRHPSVTQALPALLGTLREQALTATFFVEASNVALYPEALAAILADGHEVAHHGWRHEPWSGLEDDPAREAELLERGVAAYAGAGIAVRGFRPPGGELTAASPRLVRAAGLRWCSPAGEHEPLVRGGVAMIPFRWALVDAFHLSPRFAPLRERLGEPADPAEPEAMTDRLLSVLDALADGGGHRTLVLHPFLSVAPATLSAVTRLLAAIGERARDGRLAVGPGGPLATELLEAAGAA